MIESKEQAETFASHFYYQSHDVTDTTHYDSLKELADSLDQKYQLEGNQLFIWQCLQTSLVPSSQHLKSQGMLETEGYHRVVIENLSEVTMPLRNN